jgi:hypothetical protein
LVVFDLGEIEPQFFAVRVRESKCTPNAEGQPKGSAQFERDLGEMGHDTGRQSGGVGTDSCARFARGATKRADRAGALQAMDQLLQKIKSIWFQNPTRIDRKHRFHT